MLDDEVGGSGAGAEEGTKTKPERFKIARPELINAALDYAGRGWRVVPLHNIEAGGSCSCHRGSACPQNSRGKHPRIGVGWQKSASNNEDTVGGWWADWPSANVGVMLGPTSGIIDIEFDSPEGRATADAMLGDCFTPTYTSGRSTHRIFQWSNEFNGLPANVKSCGLEFRLGTGDKGAQSVFPPSRHHSGALYQWLPGLSPGEVDAMAVPERVALLLWNDPHGIESDASGPINGSGKPGRSVDDWKKLYQGSSEGSRNSDMAAIIGKKLRSMPDLDDAENMDTALRSAKQINTLNKPPLPDAEVETIFLSVLKREQQRRIAEITDYVLPPNKDRIDPKKQEAGAKVRMVIVDADPPEYELHWSVFSEAPRGCLRLTAAQLVSKVALRVQAIEQANYVLSKRFLKDWDAENGILQRLLASADHAAAPPDVKWPNVVAVAVWNAISDPRPLNDAIRPDFRMPTRMPDGSVCILFSALLALLCEGSDKITRKDLSRALQSAGAEDFHFGRDYELAGSGKTRVDVRVKKLSPEALESLRRQAAVEQ